MNLNQTESSVTDYSFLKLKTGAGTHTASLTGTYSGSSKHFKNSLLLCTAFHIFLLHGKAQVFKYLFFFSFFMCFLEDPAVR